MGIFDSYQASTKLTSRNDDRAGRAWAKILRFEEAKTQSGKEYLKCYKQIGRVLDGEAVVGDETTHAYFRDSYSYFEKDLLKAVKGIFGLSDEEVNEAGLPTNKKGKPDPKGSGPPMVQKLLMEEAAGTWVEIFTTERADRVKKKADGTPVMHPKTVFVRPLTQEEIDEFDLD